MRRLLGIAALVGILAAPMTARANTLAVCTFEAQVDIYPGVSMEPKETYFSSRDGALSCTGMLRGQEITGPDSIYFTGRGGNGWIGGETCVQDTSLGYVSIRLPGPDGDMYADGHFTAQRVGVVGAFDAQFSDAGIADGVFEFLAAEGQDCVNTRVTEATVMGQFVIVG